MAMHILQKHDKTFMYFAALPFFRLHFDFVTTLCE